MKRYTSFGLLALLLAVTPILASCAGAGSGGSEQQQLAMTLHQAASLFDMARS